MLGTILVGYDDSAPARRALAHAVHLAQLENARLVVVAVRERQPWLDGGVASESLDQHERTADACQLWRWAAEAYANANHVPARTETRTGPVARAIAEAARAHRADLVVLGQASESRLRNRLLRSPAERVRRRIGCPLLVIDAPAG